MTLSGGLPLGCASSETSVASTVRAPGHDHQAQPSQAQPAVKDVRREVGSEVLTAQESAWLEQHNLQRAQHCAAPLKWDRNLASAAQVWAERRVFEHTQNSGMGENLYAAAGMAGDALQAWYQEVQGYDFTAPGFSASTGHFTQLVWRGTQRLGCAAARCPNLFRGLGEAVFVVCRYAPAGNVLGEFEQNVVPVAETCP